MDMAHSSPTSGNAGRRDDGSTVAPSFAEMADALSRISALGKNALAPAGNASAQVAALGVMEAASDILSGLPPEAWSDLDPTARPADPPDERALRQAVRTLLDHLDSTRRARRDEIVELLCTAPSMDEDRLYQAYRRAADQRQLMTSVAMLGTQELAALMPDRLPSGSNLPRALERLRAQGKLLGVQVRGNWRYPAAQFDARGQVSGLLSETLLRAVARGYDEWETLHWLATPRTAAAADVEPGCPIEGLGADASLDEIVSRALSDGEVPIDPPMETPFEWLARGGLDRFRTAANRWLE